MIESNESNSLQNDSIENLDNVLDVADDNSENIEQASEETNEENNNIDDVSKSLNKAPSWVKELRKSHREKEKKIKELENQIKLFNQNHSKIEEIQKPTLEACEYDEDIFAQKMEAWIIKCENEKTKQKQQDEIRKKEAEDFEKKVERYQSQKKHLNVDDFEDCEWAVENTLSNIQQGIIVQSAENPALLVYTIGKNKEALNFLSNINDPVRFAFEVGKMELKVKQSKLNNSVSADVPLKTSGIKMHSTNSVLEALRHEAEKTGDYTKVVQYKMKNKI